MPPLVETPRLTLRRVCARLWPRNGGILGGNYPRNNSYEWCVRTADVDCVLVLCKHVPPSRLLSFITHSRQKKNKKTGGGPRSSSGEKIQGTGRSALRAAPNPARPETVHRWKRRENCGFVCRHRCQCSPFFLTLSRSPACFYNKGFTSGHWEDDKHRGWGRAGVVACIPRVGGRGAFARVPLIQPNKPRRAIYAPTSRHVFGTPAGRHCAHLAMAPEGAPQLEVQLQGAVPRGAPPARGTAVEAGTHRRGRPACTHSTSSSTVSHSRFFRRFQVDGVISSRSVYAPHTEDAVVNGQAAETSLLPGARGARGPASSASLTHVELAKRPFL